MTSLVPEEISNTLRDCGCFAYANCFQGLQTREDLYRLSLKDLVQTLPVGRDGRSVAYLIHNHLVLLQRQEMDSFNDPRNQQEGYHFTAPVFYFSRQSSSSKPSQQQHKPSKPSSSKRNYVGALTKNSTLPATGFDDILPPMPPAPTTTNSFGGAATPFDGRSRGRESVHKSSPHIICTVDNNGHKLYLCKYCEKRFSVPNQAVIHTTKHTGDKPHACNFCEKKFTQVSSRNLHIKREHPGEGKLYACQLCKKSYFHEAQLTNHMRTHNTSNGMGEQQTTYPCPYCHKVYSQFATRNVHIRNNHPDQVYK